MTATEEKACEEVGVSGGGGAGRRGAVGGGQGAVGGGRRSERVEERRKGRCGLARGSARARLLLHGCSPVGQPGEPEMLLRLKPGLPLPLLLLLGPLGVLYSRAQAGPARTEDAVELDFSTERPVHLVSPAFLSFTIDANLATDPRFLTFLG